MSKRITLIVLLLVLPAALLFSQEHEAAGITETMASLVIQLGLILFAAKMGGILAKKVRLPGVLGELLAGVLIGPYALGAIPLWGFPHGIFPLHLGDLAVSPELYGFATVASILLLFVAGLETDLSLFLRYSVAGLIVGLGGVIASFGLGVLSAVWLMGRAPGDPMSLFMGILSTATSVGITARILSDKKKMDSPEGVTILAAAVIDDVLGIILLAVVMGVVAVIGGPGESLDMTRILGIAVKALGIWLGFTVLGLLLSKQLARFLKVFKQPTAFAILSFGLALLLAGFFETEGLAMIIGAYIIGLSLSKTDIALIIQEKIHVLHDFFVPIFFAVMGMLVDLRELADPRVLAIGGIYTLLAVVAKVLGCGIPSLGLGFNPRGALRIGLGMVPRGEVALIIAGIGMSSGILDHQIFGVAILMTLATTILTPPVLNLALGMKGRGTRKEVRAAETVSTVVDLPNHEIADVVMDSLLRNLEAEGFWVQLMSISDGISQVRKGDIAVSIQENETDITITCAPEDLVFIKHVVHETLMALNASIEKLKAEFDPKRLQKEISGSAGRKSKEILKHLKTACVVPRLKAKTKEEAIKELVSCLKKAKLLADPDKVLADVFEREEKMSTGMQHGIALPHGKSDGTKGLHVAVGLAPEGIDFHSLDGEPSRIFILVVSPKRSSGPHIQFLSAVGCLLTDQERREKLLAAKSEAEIRAFFAESD